MGLANRRFPHSPGSQRLCSPFVPPPPNGAFGRFEMLLQNRHGHFHFHGPQKGEMPDSLGSTLDA